MEYQLVIYSSDTVFARMLELEFSMRGMSVLVCQQPRRELFSQIALLDLDSATPPAPDCYQRMIGFTRGETMADEDTRRACSMILRRPFEMKLLRREILEAGDVFEQSNLPKEQKIVLEKQAALLRIDGHTVQLTPKELLLAERLLADRGEAVSREALAEVIGESEGNKTDVYVCYLRRKLERVSQARLIRTVRGKGYMMV